MPQTKSTVVIALLVFIVYICYEKFAVKNLNLFFIQVRECLLATLVGIVYYVCYLGGVTRPMIYANQSSFDPKSLTMIVLNVTGAIIYRVNVCDTNII